METMTFRNDDVVIEKGSHGTCAYIIESGRVEVSDVINNQKIVLAVLGKGQIFGEMGLIEDRLRSATVRAIGDVKLAVLNRDNFNRLFEQNPKVLLPIIKALFERLRTVNKMLVSRETPDIVETNEYEYPLDSGHVILSGLNGVCKEALGASEIEINHFPFKVGREHELGEVDVLSDNDLYLKDFPPFNISRNHFLIDKADGRYVVIDRGSRLGTIANGRRVEIQSVLHKRRMK